MDETDDYEEVAEDYLEPDQIPMIWEDEEWDREPDPYEHISF